jgi:uncharacterized phage-associated protein
MPLEFRPKLDKIVELLLYLAFKRPGADKYQAVKFLYLADKEHLNRYGRPITQEVYYAMDYGPVASTALDLLSGKEGALARAHLSSLPFKIEKKSRPFKEPIVYIREPARKVDFDLFSKSDIRVFDEILEKYGNMTFQQLFQLTHNHFAYKRAWEERGGLKSSLMKYEEMIESPEMRKRILDDIGPVSSHF